MYMYYISMYVLYRVNWFYFIVRIYMFFFCYIVFNVM